MPLGMVVFARQQEIEQHNEVYGGNMLLERAAADVAAVAVSGQSQSTRQRVVPKQ